MIRQLLKLDTASQNLVNSNKPNEISNAASVKDDLWAIDFDPYEFTHAFLLVSKASKLFPNDMSLYLGTAKTFFEHPSTIGNQSILISDAGTDAKKRLSEDLGACIASLFMVKAAGLTWETISQIPQNTSLQKKRPDFQGFAENGERYLFEAKGTTDPGGVQKSMEKAIEQVKNYPESATNKFAITSYFSTDIRLFDSYTFVIDPPLPDTVLPDRYTSTLLHIENILIFGGFKETAKEYIRTLAKYLRRKREVESLDEFDFRETAKLRDALVVEIEKSEPFKYGGHSFRGQSHIFSTNGKSYEFYLGVRDDLLERVPKIGSNIFEESIAKDPVDYARGTTLFSDGTICRIRKEN
jgi:hypothetical protein